MMGTPTVAAPGLRLYPSTDTVAPKGQTKPVSCSPFSPSSASHPSLADGAFIRSQEGGCTGAVTEP